MAQKYESEYWSDRGQRRSDSICHRRIKARFLAKLEAHVEMTACKREGSGRRCAGGNSRKALRLFWERTEYADAEQPLKAWFREASNADWASPAAIKAAFGNASIVANNRVVFNIGGNKYRLVVRVNYPYRVLYVRFVGTHAQYDRINLEEV